MLLRLHTLRVCVFDELGGRTVVQRLFTCPSGICTSFPGLPPFASRHFSMISSFAKSSVFFIRPFRGASKTPARSEDYFAWASCQAT